MLAKMENIKLLHTRDDSNECQSVEEDERQPLEVQLSWHLAADTIYIYSEQFSVGQKVITFHSQLLTNYKQSYWPAI